MQTKKRAKWLRVSEGQNAGLYELVEWHGEINGEVLPDCPCCKGKLAPGFDVCQWGFWEDNYTSYLMCKACGKAYVLVYRVPTYELVSKTRQRKQGLLLSSKKSREAGSEPKGA